MGENSKLSLSLHGLRLNPHELRLSLYGLRLSLKFGASKEYVLKRQNEKRETQKLRNNLFISNFAEKKILYNICR